MSGDEKKNKAQGPESKREVEEVHFPEGGSGLHRTLTLTNPLS